ncbi:MAG: ABC transporter permease subunit, partial [Mesorhizobium sp.]
MIDTDFLVDTTVRLLGGLPLTLQLVALSILIGTALGYLLAIMRLSGWLPSSIASAYIFVFRGTPLLVQLFIIYYGLSQFESLRHSFVWP